MATDIDWFNQLLKDLRNIDSQSLIEKLGSITETLPEENTYVTYTLKPKNPRIKRIILNFEFGKLDRIAIEGNEFLLPFHFISSLISEYKTTFNTYDDIHDEQFVFFNNGKGDFIMGIESWISPDEQSEDHTRINFSDIIIHLNKKKLPYHYRDGYHFMRHK